MTSSQSLVLWEARLRIAEEPAREDQPPVVQTMREKNENVPAPSIEQQIARAAQDFGQAIVERDFKTARTLLAPWLQKQVTAKKLQTIIAKQMISDDAPTDCAATGNDSTLDELRAHYREYHKDDRTRTLTTTEEFGAWGPPSIHIANEITSTNFRQWMWLDFTPDPEGGALVDYCLRLYIIVVEVDGAMKIGHLEPGE